MLRHTMVASWVVFISLLFASLFQIGGALDVEMGTIIQVWFWNLWIYTNFVFINWGLVRYRGYAL